MKSFSYLITATLLLSTSSLTAVSLEDATFEQIGAKKSFLKAQRALVGSYSRDGQQEAVPITNQINQLDLLSRYRSMQNRNLQQEKDAIARYRESKSTRVAFNYPATKLEAARVGYLKLKLVQRNEDKKYFVHSGVSVQISNLESLITVKSQADDWMFNPELRTKATNSINLYCEVYNNPEFKTLKARYKQSLRLQQRPTENLKSSKLDMNDGQLCNKYTFLKAQYALAPTVQRQPEWNHTAQEQPVIGRQMAQLNQLIAYRNRPNRDVQLEQSAIEAYNAEKRLRRGVFSYPLTKLEAARVEWFRPKIAKLQGAHNHAQNPHNAQDPRLAKLLQMQISALETLANVKTNPSWWLNSALRSTASEAIKNYCRIDNHPEFRELKVNQRRAMATQPTPPAAPVAAPAGRGGHPPANFVARGGGAPVGRGGAHVVHFLHTPYSPEIPGFPPQQGNPPVRGGAPVVPPAVGRGGAQPVPAVAPVGRGGAAPAGHLIINDDLWVQR